MTRPPRPNQPPALHDPLLASRMGPPSKRYVGGQFRRLCDGLGALRNLPKPYYERWRGPGYRQATIPTGHKPRRASCQPSPTGPTGLTVMGVIPIALGDRVRGHAIDRLRPVIPV